MEIKSFIKDYAEREKKNHRITNIMMVSLLSLVIIFTLCFGVKVNIGSAVYDDGHDAYIRQNIYQIAATVVANDMSKEEAVEYVEKINTLLLDKYGVTGFSVYDPLGREEAPGAFEDLGRFDQIVDALGKNASKVNLLKYKFAYAVAIGNPDNIEHKQSFDGSRIYSMVGQLILIAVVQLLFAVVSAVMLAFAIIALVKGIKFSKAKLSLILLLLLSLINIMLMASSSFLFINWAGVLMIVCIFLVAICYALIQHALMDKKDFSLSMCIHNAVLLGAGLLALILFLSPMFKLTTLTGASTSLGWGYLMDYTLAEMSFMSAVMAYTLTEILMLGLLMLPASLMIAFVLLAVNRFLAADYQHNEKKILSIVILVIDLLIFVLLCAYSGGGSLNISSQYFKVRINLGIVITQLLTLAGIVAFEFVYKVKPVKKEFVIK